MLEFDHIAVAGETLDEAAQHCEVALGVPMLPGGRHAHYATHNRLLGLGDGLYLEAIAIDPSAPPPDWPRWFGLDDFAGKARLHRWICRVSDMDAALAEFPEAGTPVALQRGTLSWHMAVPADGRLPFDGMFPALIVWDSPVPPGASLAADSRKVRSLTVAHPDATALANRLGPYLNDARITFETAATPGLRAVIETADGARTLA